MARFKRLTDVYEMKVFTDSGYFFGEVEEALIEENRIKRFVETFRLLVSRFQWAIYTLNLKSRSVLCRFTDDIEDLRILDDSHGSQDDKLFEFALLESECKFNVP